MSNSNRAYDLVIWGATGVAGRLVAEHLTERYEPADLSLALGGRNEEKLEKTRSNLLSENSEWDSLPLVIGDATKPETLLDIAQDTRVICTTVGPYTKYGTPLVEACIEAGTDYCDLTGEITWVREMIDRFHERAVESNTRIVHSCGFDSIPADLGTQLVQTHALETVGSPCEMVNIYLEGGRGGVSGGTMASMVELFREVSTDPLAKETLSNPYSLAPKGERDGIDSDVQMVPRYDRLRGGWTAPSPMAIINERVIRRTNAVLGYPYGREFTCSEVAATGNGILGLVGAGGVSVGLAAATAGMQFGPTRETLSRFVFPDPGEGPTRNQIENGYFTIGLLGHGVAEDGPFVIEGKVGADRDPGYGATAIMLGEAAMCLVRDECDSPLSGGILTPASGIGQPLVERLRNAGMTFDVHLRDSQ